MRVTSFGVFAVALCGGLLACGQVEDSVRGASGEAGATASAGAEAGGSHSSGGCTGDKPTCVFGCDNNLLQVNEFTCADGQWQCPADKVDRDSCPPNSVGACLGKPDVQCVTSCSSTEWVPSLCIDRSYQCGAGAVATNTCPIGTCGHGTPVVCCADDGTTMAPACAASGKFTCPAESTLSFGQCFPKGVTANSCGDLAGQACSDAGWVCIEGCMSRCACSPGSAGTLVWECLEGNCFPD